MGTRGANNGNFVVQSRIARVSLGFNFHAPWDPTVHKKEDYSFDELRGEARAMNQIVYVVKKVCHLIKRTMHVLTNTPRETLSTLRQAQHMIFFASSLLTAIRRLKKTCTILLWTSPPAE